MNIIFLDIDGVLNSDAYFCALKQKANAKSLSEILEYDEIADCYLKNLSIIYHSCDAQIVISSSWRTHSPAWREDRQVCGKNQSPVWAYLLKRLKEYDMGVKDVTPLIDNNRPLEIVTWLSTQEESNNIRFISLDDDFERADYSKYCIGEHLIQTKFFCTEVSEGGLNDKCVEKAIKLFKQQKGYKITNECNK